MLRMTGACSCRRLRKLARARDGLAPARHQFGRIAHRLVLGVDVVHEHRYGLVARQLPAPFGRNARIGNVRTRTIADAVRSALWGPRGLAHPPPPAPSHPTSTRT